MIIPHRGIRAPDNSGTERVVYSKGLLAMINTEMVSDDEAYHSRSVPPRSNGSTGQQLGAGGR